MIDRMKLSGFLAAGVLALSLGGGAASAATLDFLGYASGNEHGVTNGTTIAFDGVDVTFNAAAGAKNAYAYFDNGAGLGVCKVLDKNKQCDPSNDDNVTNPESVTLSFGTTEYDISDISFYAEGHYPLTTDQTLLYAIDGGSYIQTTFNALDDMSFYGVTSISFKYDNSSTGEQFYISSMVATAPVPVPAAGLLLLGGLGGLAAVKRRRKAA